MGRAGLVPICLAGVLWGTGGLVVQLIREDVAMSTLTIGWWRMVIGAVALGLCVVFARQVRDVVALVRAHPWRALLVGAGTGAHQALYFGAVVEVGVTVSTVVCLGLAPVLLTVVDGIRDRARPPRSRLLVLAAALTGLVLVSAFAGHGETGPRPVLGTLLAIASGVVYAFTTASSPALARGHAPLALSAAATAFGALFLTPFATVATLQGSPVWSGDLRFVLLVLYLGVLTMGAAYLLLYAGLRTAPASSAVIATLLEPVTAAVAAATLLGERLGALGVVGAVLILLAVAGLGAAVRPIDSAP